MDFASHLQVLRKRAGHTQRSLAEAAGVPGRTGEKGESGQLPSLRVLRPLAQALGVSLEELIPEDGGLAEVAKPPPKRSAQPRTAKRPRAKAGQAAGRIQRSRLSALDAAARVLDE